MTEKEDLEKFAAQIRIETLKQFAYSGDGHIGGCMSIAELLSVLYKKVMNINPGNPGWEDRDWLVVSKGHAGPAVYATLALKGFFDIEMLKTLNEGGTNLPSHCDRTKTPGIDMTTGSLGQGISAAIGIALGNRLKKKNNWVYLIIGDGECDEGQIWEGIMFAAHHKVDNLIAFVDNNKLQIDGYVEDIMSLGDLAQKFQQFNWHVQRVNGHDVVAIEEAIINAKSVKGKPSAIILDTVKGKGCCFAENDIKNHHMSVTAKQIDQAISKIKCCL